MLTDANLEHALGQTTIFIFVPRYYLYFLFHPFQVFQLSLQNGTILRQWHESSNPILSMTALPNQMFIIGRQDGICTVISLQEAHSAIRVYLTGSDCDGIRDIAFNGKWFFTGCRDTLVRKYDFNQVNVHFK